MTSLTFSLTVTDSTGAVSNPALARIMIHKRLESNDLAKMSRVTVGAAVGIFVVLLYFSIHISYGQNANNSSSLTLFGHTFQQLDKDSNAGNLTAKDVNNAHDACNQLKHSGAPMFMFHLCSSMSR
jgi:hypothetical protein